MNTKLEYLYRDAANYKEYGEVVFAGEATEEQLRRLEAALISGELLVADQVGLPDLAPWLRGENVYDDELDHPFHEIIWPPTATTQAPDQPAVTFEAFLRRVEARARAGWRTAP